ncbi:uncharacterized protein LOC119093484 [Pollicipes pollicipes]|uniref:uncharacterized protein LOC119093484 n=1 Tax=Pollicipes pollicipes TaxID=41117 RepID=UPI001885856B|nr:uncharacterized protein LOC119093484 [Pollicipes pollicipes]
MDDGADDAWHGSADLQLDQRTWEKVQRSLHTEGYREGRAAGEEASLQEHFDAGYEQGLERVWPIAQLRGRLCAAIALHHLRGGAPEPAERAGTFVAGLTELERQLGAERRGDAADSDESARLLADAEAALRTLAADG